MIRNFPSCSIRITALNFHRPLHSSWHFGEHRIQGKFCIDQNLIRFSSKFMFYAVHKISLILLKTLVKIFRAHDATLQSTNVTKGHVIDIFILIFNWDVNKIQFLCTYTHLYSTKQCLENRRNYYMKINDSLSSYPYNSRYFSCFSFI